MDFLNYTGIEARLFFGGISERSHGGWVVARQTFRLAASGDSIIPAQEQWPVFTAPLETEFGLFPPDDFPLRNKAELLAVASATSRRATRTMTVTLQAGAFKTRLLVFGSRRWVKQGKTLVPSEPEPFVTMDLGLQNAFGGTIEYGGEKMPHPLNPHGRGFCLSPEAAEGALLPSVEHPDWPLRSWNDQPLIGTWSLVPDGITWQMAACLQERTRERAALRPPAKDEDENAIRQAVQKRALQTFPTAAPPGLLLDALNPGDPIALDLGEAAVRFSVPKTPVDLRVKVGKSDFVKTLAPIAVWIFVPKNLVVVTWLARFRYAFRPGERRLAILLRV